ncbi:MAG TPA: CocE/NonD family hydrolase [Mycobacteriales bacterium]
MRRRTWTTRRRALAVVLAGALCLCGVVLVVPASAGPRPAAPWHPEAATYGVGEVANLGVTMSDGTVLRVDEYYPTTASGAPAPGPFPVLLTQVPYGKDGLADPVEGNSYENPYFVQRGYLEVVADVRGTGDSQGQFGLFDPVQATDGATLVDWCAHLPRSNGNVGLFGGSYFGINQFLTAAAVGPHSHLKAIFPEVAGKDVYRDTAFFGGAFDAEFGAIFLGGTAEDNLVQPPQETAKASSPDPGDTAGVELQHAGGVAAFQGAMAANLATGGDETYDGAYWLARSPQTMLQRIVDNHIPAFMVGGWYDLFQRGEPLNYSGLQNAYDGRPVTAPMLPDQKVTGRYQLIMEPRYHLTCCVPPSAAIDDNAVQLAWFDQFLRGENTGITDTTHPLHVYELGGGGYVDARTYPFAEATPTTLYLGAGPSGSTAPSTNDGTLGASRPTNATGADTVLFTGASEPCDRQTEQWAAGTPDVGLQAAGLGDDPCASNDILKQAGPGSLTYTTAPFARDEVVAGPVDVTVYATSTAPDTYLEATLEDVPAGKAATSTPLTAGALLGSLRAVDRARSWYAPSGAPVLPYHPYTQSSQTPVPVGAVTRFDIEVFPTFAEIHAGDRLRLTITTSDSPHVLFTPAQLAHLAGGVYGVQRNAAASSFVEVPLAPTSAYTDTCRVCRNPLP